MNQLVCDKLINKLNQSEVHVVTVSLKGLIKEGLTAVFNKLEDAENYANEIETNFLPAEWVFRGPYLKGLLITFDFHELAKQKNVETIKDIYGNIHCVENIDALISVSQFKAWQAFENIKDYNLYCQENNYSWGISRCSPKKDKDFCFSTYQYVQGLNIQTKEQIEKLYEGYLEAFDLMQKFS